MSEQSETDTDVNAAPLGEYQVLARKYRPKTFADVIGQDALVRTLRNAFATGRVAHAFILTGVRGVGKTTTARLLAKALNCIGPDGTGNETFEPCGECEPCIAIAQSRHVDVLEMDAASRTGIGDVREIIDSVRYTPISARYKVYIIDEVHMLSTAAFNGLLKTLEEPPDHVKFIFATTEIRKVPVTVLSRCQRFDLRRVEGDVLGAHLAQIAEKEGVQVDEAAIRLLTRAAEGSVRDGQSLLDQAFAHSHTEDDSHKVTEEQIRDMLGLADRGRVLDLLEAVMDGDIKKGLLDLRDLYDWGADASVIIRDMLELTHALTTAKVIGAVSDANLAVEEEARLKTMASKLPMPTLSRAWQMLLKGLDEVGRAPQPLAAAEMVLIRLSYVADLPTPAEMIATLEKEEPAEKPAKTPAEKPAASAPAPASASASPSPSPSASPSTEAVSKAPIRPEVSAPSDAAVDAPIEAALAIDMPMEVTPLAETANEGPALGSFQDVIDYIGSKREGRLKLELENYAHPVAFETGRLELRLETGAPKTMLNRLSKFLADETGSRWIVAISKEPGGETVVETRARENAEKIAAAGEDPAIRSVLDVFPGAEVTGIRDLDSDDHE